MSYNGHRRNLGLSRRLGYLRNASATPYNDLPSWRLRKRSMRWLRRVLKEKKMICSDLPIQCIAHNVLVRYVRHLAIVWTRREKAEGTAYLRCASVSKSYSFEPVFHPYVHRQFGMISEIIAKHTSVKMCITRASELKAFLQVWVTHRA